MDLATCSAFRCSRIHPRGDPFYTFGEYGLGVVLVGHRIVVAGGETEVNFANRKSVYVYDTARNTWRSYKSANVSISLGAVRLLFIADDKVISLVWRQPNYKFVSMDLVENEFSLITAAIPPSLGRGTSGCYFERRNEAALFGGQEGSQQVYMYSVRKNSWWTPQTKGIPPLSRYHHATCAMEEKMFVLGGSHDEAEVLDIHVLDLKNDVFAWSTPDIASYQPPPRFLFTATAVGDRIIVYGGYTGERCFDVYSISQNRWFLGVTDVVDTTAELKFKTEWYKGSADNAMVLQNPQKLWLFGGLHLPMQSPLQITPLLDSKRSPKRRRA